MQERKKAEKEEAKRHAEEKDQRVIMAKCGKRSECRMILRSSTDRKLVIVHNTVTIRSKLSLSRIAARTGVAVVRCTPAP